MGRDGNARGFGGNKGGLTKKYKNLTINIKKVLTNVNNCVILQS